MYSFCRQNHSTSVRKEFVKDTGDNTIITTKGFTVVNYNKYVETNVHPLTYLVRRFGFQHRMTSRPNDRQSGLLTHEKDILEYLPYSTNQHYSSRSSYTISPCTRKPQSGCTGVKDKVGEWSSYSNSSDELE